MVQEQEPQQEERKVAMVVVAHPDDAEFGSAGTLAKWAREGWDVYQVIVTDGASGGPDEATEVGPEARRKMTETRKAEQRQAAAVLGVKDVIFLDYPDGEVQPSLELRKDIVRLLRTYRPTRVICPSPDRTWTPAYAIGRYHPDHLAVGQAAMAAVYPAAQNPWDFPELLEAGLAPHKIQELYISGAPVNNHAVDISETIEQKIEALRAHHSQLGDHMEQIEEWIRGGSAKSGEEYNMAYAERFHFSENR
ncbi:MAG TPA: PIG-L deacetylase family protein [Thermomicrobiaceae bacterium]|nr:PIG-L deacetylase family protein [Thermomicrobiaceae bacterium]